MKKLNFGFINAFILIVLASIGTAYLLLAKLEETKNKPGSVQAGNCPVINRCVADHEERRCNNQGQKCTYYVGEPGYELSSGTCTPGQKCPGSADHYCMHYGSCYACIKYETCEYRSPDNCVDDESCGGSQPTPTPTRTPTPAPTPTPTSTPTPTPPYGSCGAACNDFVNCLPSLNCPGGPGGGTCVNGACPQDPDCICEGTPTPTPTPRFQCNAICVADSQCLTSFCHTTSGRCRNPLCPTSTNCICSVTPTPTPTRTPTPTPTHTPFCTPTPTPNITPTPTLTPSFSPTPTPSPTPTVTPTSTPTPTPTETPIPTPNWCNGTCGSNSNCQSGYFCYYGFCRVPACADSATCSCATPTPTPIATPQVLGATAPPELPKTGGGMENLPGLFGIASLGIYLIRRYRLI